MALPPSRLGAMTHTGYGYINMSYCNITHIRKHYRQAGGGGEERPPLRLAEEGIL